MRHSIMSVFGLPAFLFSTAPDELLARVEEDLERLLVDPRYLLSRRQKLSHRVDIALIRGRADVVEYIMERIDVDFGAIATCVDGTLFRVVRCSFDVSDLFRVMRLVVPRAWGDMRTPSGTLVHA